MSDEGAEQGQESAEAQPEAPATGAEALGDAGKQALDRMKAARDEAQRELRQVRRELGEFRQASMSEAERAVAEAEERGRRAAVQQFGVKLARAEFGRLAAQRNPEAPVDDVLEFVDLGRFLGDDGELDVAGMGKAVEKLVPAAAPVPADDPFVPRRGSIDQGARQHMPLNGDPLEQSLRDALGIR